VIREMKKIFAVFLLLIVVFGSNICCGQDDPRVGLRDQAFTKIRVAQQIMMNANGYMSGRPNRNDLRIAVQLYAQAGQMFQEAGNMLQYIGPDYASQQDIDGCDKVMNDCLEAIKKIKTMLNAEV